MHKSDSWKGGGEKLPAPDFQIIHTRKSVQYCSAVKRKTYIV